MASEVEPAAGTSSSAFPGKMRLFWFGNLQQKREGTEEIKRMLLEMDREPRPSAKMRNFLKTTFISEFLRDILKKHRFKHKNEPIPPKMEPTPQSKLFAECKKNFNNDDFNYEFLKKVVRSKFLPAICRNLIFKSDMVILIDEISPIIADYVMFKEMVYSDIENPAMSLFSNVMKQSDPHPSVKKIVRMIDNSGYMYNMVMQITALLYMNTENNSYCSLRFDINIMLHQKKATVFKDSNSLGFILWMKDCLDKGRIEPNCKPSHVPVLRMPTPDDTKAYKSKFQIILDNITMTVLEPRCLDMLCDSLVSYFIANMDESGIARDSHFLILLKILNLGLYSWLRFDNDEKISVLAIQPILDFLVPFSFMTYEAIKRVNNRPSATRVIKRRIFSNTYIVQMKEYCEKDMICSLMALNFTLAVVQKADRISICQMMMVLPSTYKKVAYSDWFLNQLVVELIRVREIFMDLEVVDMVFNNFLMEEVGKLQNVPRHVLKLMLFLRDFSHMHKQLKRMLLVIRKAVVVTEDILKKFRAHFDYEEESSTDEFDPESLGFVRSPTNPDKIYPITDLPPHLKHKYEKIEKTSGDESDDDDVPLPSSFDIRVLRSGRTVDPVDDGADGDGEYEEDSLSE